MAWAGAAVSAAGMATQKDSKGGSMLNVFGRMENVEKTKDKKAKETARTKLAMDNLFGGGLGLFSSGGDDEMNLEDLLVYKQLPDYPETTEAISEWSNRLKEWGGQEGYGAIPMNWDEIWNTAKDKLNRYYWGGVNDTGLAGKVRASAARRGVSQSPALENQLNTLGFQQGIDLNQLATTEATNKVTYGEAGRNTWLGSLERLSNIKPSYITSAGAVSPAVSAMYGDAQQGDTGGANMIGSIGSLLAQYLGNSGGGNNNSGGGEYGLSGQWANNYLNNYNWGTSQNSLVSSPAVSSPTYGSGSAWSQNYLNNYNFN
jgi:hypothetical protein